MKRLVIKSVEEAVKIAEESSINRGAAIMNGDAKAGNKYVPIQNKALVYLYNHDSLAALRPLLSHSDFNVRLYAAYALLPLFEFECRRVLSEIANGDAKIYEIQSLNAEMTLQSWEDGELVYPYQSDFNKINSIEPMDINKKNVAMSEKKKDVKCFSPEILRLSHIFACPPISDTEIRNEEYGLYIRISPATKEITINVNTFVNPYTQDISEVYQKRLERFKAYKCVATISADRPSKLGFMKIIITLPGEKGTDKILTQIKDTIYSIFNEWKPNETLVCFKTEYSGNTCFFEGEWWMPTRAVIKNKQCFERYDFSDEMNYDEEMWNIVQGKYDQFELSDSFSLVPSNEFQRVWETTRKNHGQIRVRQFSRLTGISFGVIQKLKNDQ